MWNSLDLNVQYTHARWNSFYDITEQHDIDVLMMGNSRVYNGINPKLLASKMEITPFVLAAPGSSIKDQFYSFKEILKRTKVRMLVIETYCINNAERTDENAVYQLNSFHAKKDFSSKLFSTPYLFDVNHWPYAWFGSIRNHNFLFDEQQNLRKNTEEYSTLIERITKGEDEKYMDSYKLYLGKFNTGSALTLETLERYKKEGPAVDGRNMIISEESRYYVNKLDELCRKENIELVFITIPVYFRHIKNYEFRQNALTEIIEPLSRKWCNLQVPFDTSAFHSNCFENSYESNQHTTLEGSLVATSKFAQFLKENYTDQLPNRSLENEWNELFYGEDYYFYSHPLKPNDPINRTLGPIYSIDGVKIEQICLQEQSSIPTIFAKVKRTKETEHFLKSMSLLVNLSIKNKNNKIEKVAVTLPYSDPCSTESHLIFTKTIKKLNIINIHKIRFYPTGYTENKSS